MSYDVGSEGRFGGQQKAIGLKFETATKRPLSELLYLSGEVRPVPGRQAEVSTRISGQVKRIDHASVSD